MFSQRAPRHIMVASLCFAALGADQTLLSTKNEKEASTPQAIDRLTQAWDSNEVNSVVILYVPRITHVLTHIQPKYLDSEFTYCLEVRDPRSRPVCCRLMKLLEKTKTRPSKNEADVHWGFIFQDKRQERICSIYVQAVGRTAVVDGSSVELDSDELVSWANKTFGATFEE